MSDFEFDRSMNAIQENLLRIPGDDPKFKLTVPEDKASKVMVLLQTGLNELGQKGLLGADFKPLEVTGKTNPEFIEAFKNYLAIKRPESTDFFEGSYKGLPDVNKTADITVAHVSALLDSVHDAGILQKDTKVMKLEALEALREMNHHYLRHGIEGLERDLKSKGVDIRPVSEAVNDGQFRLASCAPVNAGFKPT